MVSIIMQTTLDSHPELMGAVLFSFELFSEGSGYSEDGSQWSIAGEAHGKLCVCVCVCACLCVCVWYLYIDNHGSGYLGHDYILPHFI